MTSITIKNTVIGSGRPKICVPVLSSNLQALEKDLETYQQKCTDKSAYFDLLEWRLDHLDLNFEQFAQQTETKTAIHHALTHIYKIFPNTPVILTFRTAEEGGHCTISKDDYHEMLLWLVENHRVDLLDIEYDRFDPVTLKQLISRCREQACSTIISHHNFAKTPDAEALAKKLNQIRAVHADIDKIAVMPQCKADVLTLLNAVHAHTETHQVPTIAMAMNKLGMPTRLIAELCNICITFGKVAKNSAPGQVDSKTLHDCLELLTLSKPSE